MLVHEQALFTVKGVTPSGAQVLLPQPPVWSSSDESVASVTADGVVKGSGRGEALMTVRVGAAAASATVHVTARVKIVPAYSAPWHDHWQLAVGDSLRFAAEYVDINGAPIGETPTGTWTSSNPAAVSVSPSGLAVGLVAGTTADISVATAEGLALSQVRVSDVIAGLPATLRLAHTALHVGPVTFLPSRAAPVTLSFGESVELPIQSGMLYVETTGAPVGQSNPSRVLSKVAMIRGGDHLSLFAVGGPTQVYLTAAWATPVNIPADSGLVRFIQSSSFAVVYLRPSGAPMSGLPEFCYFDPGDPTEYFRRGTGEFDVILQNKYSTVPVGPEVGRSRVATAGGRAMTYVLIGDTPATVGVIAFLDP